MTLSSSRRGPRRACGYVWLVTDAIVVPARAVRDRHGFPDALVVPHPSGRSSVHHGGRTQAPVTWRPSAGSAVDAGPGLTRHRPRRPVATTFVDRMSRRRLARPDGHGVPPRRGRGARVLAHSLPGPPAPRPRLPRCLPLPRRAAAAAARRSRPAPDPPLSRSRRRAGRVSGRRLPPGPDPLLARR